MAVVHVIEQEQEDKETGKGESKPPTGYPSARVKRCICWPAIIQHILMVVASASALIMMPLFCLRAGEIVVVTLVLPSFDILMRLYRFFAEKPAEKSAGGGNGNGTRYEVMHLCRVYRDDLRRGSRSLPAAPRRRTTVTARQSESRPLPHR